MQYTVAIPNNEVNFTSTELSGPLESVYSCFSCAHLIFQNLNEYERDIVEAWSQYLNLTEFNIECNYHEMFKKFRSFVKAQAIVYIMNLLITILINASLYLSLFVGLDLDQFESFISCSMNTLLFIIFVVGLKCISRLGFCLVKIIMT